MGDFLVMACTDNCLGIGRRSDAVPSKTREKTNPRGISPLLPPRPMAWIFAATMFLSAFLLFNVQLIISKYILPWFGGSAAVWTTSMLVFQLLLLAGYLYAHILAQLPSRDTQTKVHLVS